MKLKTEVIKGATIEIFVTPEGSFSASLGEQGSVAAPSLEELRTKVAKALTAKRAKVNVPVVLLRYGKTVRGALTGIHASTKNLLFKSEEGTTEQLGTYSDSIYPIECEAELTKLAEASMDAQKAVTAFENAHRINPRQLIDAAIQEALKGEEKANS